jgi:hypothetical protein
VSARRLGQAVLVLGLPLMVAIRIASPTIAPPLYDGLIVEDPYRYLAPPPGGAGSPTSFQDTLQLDGGKSPPAIGATAEQPPQAQMITSPDAFPIAPRVKSISVSIAPVPPAVQPAAGTLLGNVYRFAVNDDHETPLAPTSPVTIVLRSPSVSAQMAIAHLEAGRWVPLPTDQAGQPRIYAANVKALGDFAVIGTGAGTSESTSPSGSGGASASPAASGAVHSPVPGQSAPPGSGFDPVPLLIGLVLGVVAIVILIAAVRPAETIPSHARPRSRSKRRRR